MKRMLSIVLILACLSGPLAARTATAAPDELLSAVPAEAWGLISVRSLAELDKKLMNLGQAVNSPTAGMSSLAMAKGLLGLVSGVNDDGGLALVIMPAESLDQLTQHVAVLVPTSNYTELLSLMEPEDAGGGVSKILFRGTESYVVPKGGFAVIGPSLEVVKAVAQSKTTVASKFTPHQLKQWAADDVTLWIDAAAVTSGPVLTPHLEQIKTQGVDAEMLSEFKSLQLSLRFGPEGIRIGWYHDARPGTAMAKAMASLKPPSGSLLTGLPGDQFAFAFGVALGGELAAYKADVGDRTLAAVGPMMPMLNPEAFAQLRSIFKTLVSRMHTLSFSISTLPEGPDGVLAATEIVTVGGSAADYLASIAEMIGVVKADLVQEQEESAEVTAWLKALLGMLEYQPAGEGESSDRLAVHLDKAEGLSAEDLAVVKKILGQDGLVVRLSAVDEHHVAITLGGGAARMQTVAALIKQNKSPLVEMPEIKKVAETMPAGRISEGYLSANGLMAAMSAVAKATDGEVPIQLPPIATPLTVTARATEGGGSHTDIVIPMEMIKAVVQAGMAMFGPGPPPEATPM